MILFTPSFHKRACRRPSKLRSALFCLPLTFTFFASAQSSTTHAPMLSPQPKEVHAQQLFPVHSVSVLVPGGDTDDLFAAQNLNTALAERGILIAPSAGFVDLTVKLLRQPSSEVNQLLSESKLSFSPAMHDEGYGRSWLCCHHRPNIRRDLLWRADAKAAHGKQ
jgi:hypothetical protein